MVGGTSFPMDLFKSLVKGTLSVSKPTFIPIHILSWLPIKNYTVKDKKQLHFFYKIQNYTFLDASFENNCHRLNNT